MMKSPKIAFQILLVGFVVLALGYSFVIPLGEAPDEVSHWAYIWVLVTRSQLPQPEGEAVGEAHQPPLYYMLGALVSVWVPRAEFQIIANPDFAPGNSAIPNLLLHSRAESFPYRGVPLAWHLTRVLSTALGAVTIWATWRIALEILPTEPWLALGAVSFVAFLPGFVTLSAVVNNDNLVIALSHLGVWQLIRMMHAPRRVRDEILLGGILGLALLAKLNASALWIFAAIVLGWRAYQTRTWRNGALTFGWCFGIALALGSPWMFYNLRTYGDPLGWSLYQVVGTLRPTPMTFNEWLVVIPQLVTSFWGRPGGMLNIHLPNELYIALTVLATVSLVGWVQFLRNAELDFARRARRSLALFAAFWVPMLIVYVQWASNDYAPDQARRLFPGLGLLAIILVVGFTRPAGDRKHIALAVWISGFFTLTVGVLVYLHLSYAVVPQNLARLEPLGGIGTPADFGGTIRIADFRVAPRRVIAGERINVQVYWQAIQSPQENYWMSLQLGGTEGAIANQDGVPSAGRLTTDWWLQDQVFVSHHSITVPADARAGKYTLRLGLHPYGKWEWLSVRGGDMLTLAGIEVIEQ